MIQWYMKYWFYVSHIPDQIRIWKCCFLRRQEKNKDKPPKVPFPGFLSHSDRILASFIHSFMKPYQSADYFIKARFPYCSGYEQENKISTWESFFYHQKCIYYQKRWKRVCIHACHCTT